MSLTRVLLGLGSNNQRERNLTAGLDAVVLVVQADADQLGWSSDRAPEPLIRTDGRAAACMRPDPHGKLIQRMPAEKGFVKIRRKS